MGSVRVGYAIACKSHDAIDFDGCTLRLREMTQKQIDRRLGKGHDKDELLWHIQSAKAFVTPVDIPFRQEPGWTVFWAEADDWGDGGDERTRALEGMINVGLLDCIPPLGDGGYIWTDWGEGMSCPSTAEAQMWDGHPDRVSD